MRCKLLLIYLLFTGLSALRLSATHIVGAEIFYDCVNPAQNQYDITLKLYRDCKFGQAEFDSEITLFVFEARTGRIFRYLTSIKPPLTPEIRPENWNACVGRPYDICVEEGIYKASVILPPLEGGYYLGWARCCRNAAISNLVRPLGEGVTYLAKVPGPEVTTCNNMPLFEQFPPIFLCANQTFSFDHSAFDPDGDSLSYAITDPFTGLNTQGQGAGNPQQGGNQPIVNLNNPMGPPPYRSVAFSTGYTFNDPFGSRDFNIDPQTGFITVTPRRQGIFVFSISVFEWRNKKLIGENRRDFQIHIVNCLEGANRPQITHNLTGLRNLNDTIYVTANDPFCYEVKVTDPDILDRLAAFPLSAPFGLGGFFPPQATFTAGGANPINGQVCWQPSCAYAGRIVPLIIGARDVPDCTNFADVRDTVWVKVGIPPNNPPLIQADVSKIPKVRDTLVVDVESLLNFNFTVTDPDKNFVEAFPLGKIFDLPNPPAFSISGQGPLNGNIQWTPGCEYVGQVFPLVIGAKDFLNCNKDSRAFDTLYVKVQLPLNLAPTIAVDLSGNTFLNDTLYAVAGEEFCYTFEAGDPNPADILRVFRGSAIFDTLGGPDLFFGGNNPITGQVCWKLDCDRVGEVYPLTITAADNAKCNTGGSISRTVYVVVDPPRNIAPEIDHDLKGNISRGDTIFINPNQELRYRITAIDANRQDSLALFPISEIFSTDSLLSLSYDGLNPLEGEVRWQVDCSYQGKVFPLILQTRDFGECTEKSADFDTVYVAVGGDANLPPLIGSDLTGNTFSNDTIYIEEGDSLCYRFYIADQTLTTGLEYNFEFQRVDGTSIGLGDTDVVVKRDSILGTVCFRSDCSNGGSTYKLIVTGRDPSLCPPLKETRDTVFVKVNTQFISSAGTDLEFCAGEGGVQINANASGGQGPYLYTWNCTDPPNCGIGNPGSANPTVNPSQSTTFYVQATDRFGCTSEIDSLRIVVKPLPQADAGPDAFICAGTTSIQLNGRITNSDLFSDSLEIQWIPATGLNNPTILNPIASPTGNTIYTLLARVPGGCSSIATTLDTLSTVAVRFQPLPISNAGPDQDLCLGDTIPLLGFASGGENYTYRWNPSTGLDDSNKQSPLAFPTQNSRYILYASANGCEGRPDTMNIRIRPLPVPAEGRDTLILACVGDSVQLGVDFINPGTEGPFDYQWSIPGSFETTRSPNPKIKALTTTKIGVVGTSIYGCKSDVVEFNMTVQPTPLAIITGDNTLCQGDSLILTGSHIMQEGDSNLGPVIYTWRNTEGIIAQNSFYKTIATTDREYTLTVSYGNCSTSALSSVKTGPRIPLKAETDQPEPCKGETIQLFARGGNADTRYLWSPAEKMKNPGIFNPTVKMDTSTLFVIQAELNGCVSIDSILIVPKENPELSVSAAAIGVCIDEPLTLQGIVSSNATYSWDFGNGQGNSSSLSPQYSYTRSGMYQVILTATGANGCISKDSSLSIEVYPEVLADFSTDLLTNELAFVGRPIQFLDRSRNGLRYRWNFGNEGIDSVKNPTYTYLTPGRYTVTQLVIGKGGCIDTASLTFDLLIPDLFVPNVFTPNGDGLVDEFVVRYFDSEPYHIEIFDRWGKRQFESADPRRSWTGTLSDGNKAPEGVYYYVLTIGEDRRNGHLTLLR